MKTAVAALVLFGLIALATKPAIGQAFKAKSVPAIGSAPAMTTIASGILVKVDGNKMIIGTSQGGADKESKVTVPTDAKTQFIVDFDAGKLADLKPTMRVTVLSVPAVDDRPAQVVVRGETAKCIQGRIVGVEGTNLIVNANLPGGVQEITIATDEKTKVLFGQRWRGVPAPAQRGKLEELEPGMLVKVIPDMGPAATIYTPPTLAMPMAR
jgi:hypothetical protein